MHNLKLIRRRFPKQGDKIVAILALLTVVALIGGVVLLNVM